MQVRAMGRGSISSLLKLAVDAGWILACVVLGFIWIITIVSMLSAGGQPVPIGGIDRIVIADPTGIARWTINGTISCLGVMVVCAQLRGVFETLVSGDPFVPDNARRLRAIALILAIMETVRFVIGLTLHPALQALGLTGTETVEVMVSLNVSTWFAVLTLLVLGQVFAEGAALREDQKMTI
jgi:hypothetical protein